MPRTRNRKESQSQRDLAEKEKRLASWVPKTHLGKQVMAGEITDINQIFEGNQTIMEPEIVDKLLDLEEKLIDVRKTTRVIASGRHFSFRAGVLVGNRNGFVGLGVAKDAEKWPAIRKATQKAKMNLVKAIRGCGSWECNCGTGHSIPFRVKGKNASVRVTLLPAPKGVGLVAGSAIRNVLSMAGIRDVWTKVRGATDTRLNSIRATLDALKQTGKVKVSKNMERKIERRK